MDTILEVIASSSSLHFMFYFCPHFKFEMLYVGSSPSTCLERFAHIGGVKDKCVMVLAQGGRSSTILIFRGRCVARALGPLLGLVREALQHKCAYAYMFV